MSTGRHNAQELPQRLLAADARPHLLDPFGTSGALLARGRRAGGPADV